MSKRGALRNAIGFLLPLLATVATACGGDSEPPWMPPPAELQVSGTYTVATPLALTVVELAPDPAHDYLRDLRGLHDDPARTMFKLLDDADVPVASDLFNALPGPLQNKLAGWMNDHIRSAKIDGQPVLDDVALVTSRLDTILTHCDLGTEMTLADPDAEGRMAVQHRLTSLSFNLYHGVYSVTVPDQAVTGAGSAELDAALHPDTTTSGRVAAASDGADADLAVGDHGFGVPYGAYALDAIEQEMQRRNGTDLRGELGKLIVCSAMAADVSGKCLLGACVGHEGTLESICDQALDLAVSNLKARLASELTFKAVRFQNGTSDMWDAPDAGGARDGRVDRLTDGVWKASIDIGFGARPVPATFTAVRH